MLFWHTNCGKHVNICCDCKNMCIFLAVQCINVKFKCGLLFHEGFDMKMACDWLVGSD